MVTCKLTVKRDNSEYLECAGIKRAVRGPKAKCFSFSIHPVQEIKRIHRPNYREPAKMQAPCIKRWHVLQIFKKVH